MAKLKLKSVFDKAGKTALVLRDLCQQMNEDLCISDLRDKLLFGETLSNYEDSKEIIFDGVQLGSIKGGSKIISLTIGLLESLLRKEKEKKEVGAEVLDLYREINLIYNFSEQLADRIDPHSIAELALEEANRIMKTIGGSVILHSEGSAGPELLAEIGSSLELLNGAGGTEKLALLMQHENPEILTREVLLFFSGDYHEEWGSMIYAPLKVKNIILGVIYLIGSKEQVFTAADVKLLTTIALQAASAIESALMYEKQIKEAKEREETMKKIQEMTARFVPFEFLKSLGRKSIMETQLGDLAENVVTVVFLDIRSFTTLSEGMTPEDNFRFVNSFNGRVGPIIKSNNGFINQYLGDGIMAIFPYDPSDALKAAVEIQQDLLKYNTKRISKDRKAIRLGIGIHTGPLIMGITGDDKRWEATTISDTVNTASRIESLTKFYKCNIIFSHQSHELIQDINQFNVRSLGQVQVKGRREAIRIYECFDGDPKEMIHHKLSSLEQFNQGIACYEKKEFRGSTRSFSQVLVGNPDDETAQSYLGRISNILSSEFSIGWNGVDKMSEK